MRTFPKMFLRQGVGGRAGAPKKGGGGASYLNGLHRFGVEAGAVEKGGGSFGRNFMGGHDYSLGSR